MIRRRRRPSHTPSPSPCSKSITLQKKKKIKKTNCLSYRLKYNLSFGEKRKKNDELIDTTMHKNDRLMTESNVIRNSLFMYNEE